MSLTKKQQQEKCSVGQDEKKSQTGGHRKPPLTLLSVLQLTSGAVSKTERRELVFSS